VIERPTGTKTRGGSGDASPPRPGTVLQGGRAKAYRPLPAEARRRAYDAALEAYDRGDFFEAHELLEPAWMGTDDPAERALHQGLIKLAAAFVHGVRGNTTGIAKNLAGAREHLKAAVGTPAAAASGLDVAALVDAVDDRLARLAVDATDATIEAPALRRTTPR
jgi:DUF309 family protein family protein